MSDHQDQEQLLEESKLGQMGMQVLNNELYKRCMTVRKAQLFEVFCKTTKDQSDIREEAWRTMKNLEALESFFEQALTTGQMADQQLEKLNNSNH